MQQSADSPVTSKAQPLLLTGGAVFDPTGLYRYSLWRRWDAAAPAVAFMMLNPSTADATTNDPTIRRCLQFAQRWGYGSLAVVNLFAYRTPHPLTLRNASDPVGLDNDRHLLTAANRADRIILAWGNWGSLFARDRTVLQLLAHHQLYCLGINQSQQPRHPLYVRGDRPLVPFERGGSGEVGRWGVGR